MPLGIPIFLILTNSDEFSLEYKLAGQASAASKKRVGKAIHKFHEIHPWPDHPKSRTTLLRKSRTSSTLNQP